jgi:hypothetical protein|tara:strand:- start:68 stop:361 length:294 start_codon:yes stop_codon:yes gene_type:complete
MIISKNGNTNSKETTEWTSGHTAAYLTGIATSAAVLATQKKSYHAHLFICAGILSGASAEETIAITEGVPEETEQHFNSSSLGAELYGVSPTVNEEV